jgi:heat shock protein 4
MSTDPRFDHIDQAEKQKVMKECTEAEHWLREMMHHQDALPKHATPILFSTDIKKKAEALDRFCKPIMTRPKPTPPKQQTPPPTEKQPEQTEQADHPSAKEQEPMATDNPEGSATPAS